MDSVPEAPSWGTAWGSCSAAAAGREAAGQGAAQLLGMDVFVGFGFNLTRKSQ